MAYKVIISTFIACQLSLLPGLAQAQSSNLQQSWVRANQPAFDQKLYLITRPNFTLETNLQGRFNDQGFLLPQGKERADIGVARKVGIGAGAMALVGVFYFSLLWLILQSYVLVFVPAKTHKKTRLRKLKRARFT